MPAANEIITEIIAQRWQIIEHLGEGNMSYVYKAQDISTGKIIILKLIKNLATNNLAELEILAKQAKTFIALNHENIASYYDTCVCDKGLFLFCDYLTGESLSSLLSKVGKLPLEKCVKLCQQIVAGLEYAHERAIVHGDLRPSNIYIVNDQFNTDEPKIVDFGFMHLIEPMLKNNKQHVSSALPVFGDGPYMSPEQRSGQNIDKRSDLYSLGCLMYEIACGKPPFISKSTMETTYKQKNKAPTELEQLLPAHALLSRYQLIANRLLRPNLNERYKSASLVKQDLDLLTTAKEQEWQKKANALKKPTFNVLSTYRWQFVLGTLSLAILIFLLYPLASIMMPYYSPWTDKSFDNNKLWLYQSQSSEKPSAKLSEQRDFLTNRLNQIAQEKGKSSPQYIRILFSLTQFLLASGQFNEALTRLNELKNIVSVSKSINPAELSANIAFAQYASGDLNSAEQSARKVLEMSQNDDQIEIKITALKVLGDTYSNRGDIVQAESIYEQMYNLAKKNRLNNAAEYAYSNALLADIWRRENKLKESENLYKEAIDWGGNYVGHHGLFLAKAYYGLALLYYQQGNLKAADFQLKQAFPIALARLGANNNFVNAIKSLSDYILFHENIFAWYKAKVENKNNI